MRELEKRAIINGRVLSFEAMVEHASGDCHRPVPQRVRRVEVCHLRGDEYRKVAAELVDALTKNDVLGRA